MVISCYLSSSLFFSKTLFNYHLYNADLLSIHFLSEVNPIKLKNSIYIYNLAK
jgi:hypothetical protein